MGRKVYVVGVGMTKFEKPGRREGWDYSQMAEEAGSAALADAGIPYAEIEPTVSSRWASRRCSGARWGSPSTTAPSRWTGTCR